FNFENFGVLVQALINLSRSSSQFWIYLNELTFIYRCADVESQKLPRTVGYSKNLNVVGENHQADKDCPELVCYEFIAFHDSLQD
ncbi:MAG: hypothetical protein CML33_07825, partial [Rhodobacteraceae bacterium]|nr:hypothetical protein [Paracoccaceae bacterium]